MAQFRVFENTNKATRKNYPYLLSVQTDLLDDLNTTAVIPLSPASLAASAAMTRLTPQLEIEGRPFIALTPQIAGISKKLLGPPVADLTAFRDEIIAALDFMVSGV